MDTYHKPEQRPFNRVRKMSDMWNDELEEVHQLLAEIAKNAQL